jgi:hypothetical protein
VSNGSRRLRDYSRSSGFVQTIPVFADNTLQMTVINGVSSTNTLPTAATILTMTQSNAVALAGTFNFTSASGKYLIIAIPKYFGLVTAFTGSQTTFTLLTPSPAIILGVGDTGTSTNDVPLEVNLNGNLIEYNVWVSNATSGIASPTITVT